MHDGGVVRDGVDGDGGGVTGEAVQHHVHVGLPHQRKASTTG